VGFFVFAENEFLPETISAGQSSRESPTPNWGGAQAKKDGQPTSLLEVAEQFQK
jgi:hypothetical protein